MNDINQIIDAYPDEYLAIKKQAKKYVQNASNIDDNQGVNILHRPWVARLNWGLMIYKGADTKRIDEAEATISKTIPNFYKCFLTNINGCFLYDISMFGLIHSLTRSFLQCHSLTTANNDWIKGFNVDQSFFHFGGGYYSDKENTGYFYGQGKIMSIRKNGKLVNEWSSFSDFLNEELLRAENEMLKEVPKKTKLIVTE
ncbi:MAG: hypothetical protein JWR61_1111 [Ferruginibacter sp.]|uniref:SMI1/KNR4 family protein n=1 Tax=Ferruginibacter sp. TaxID=1940288 RepID=UPI00265844FF|nr:SMI1/KNR4 family protein [Ferruginibacter sp.]MDB5276156.1 hypothetical protein [Ferruginibacter sp.]